MGHVMASSPWHPLKVKKVSPFMSGFVHASFVMKNHKMLLKSTSFKANI